MKTWRTNHCLPLSYRPSENGINVGNILSQNYYLHISKASPAARERFLLTAEICPVVAESPFILCRAIPTFLNELSHLLRSFCRINSPMRLLRELLDLYFWDNKGSPRYPNRRWRNSFGACSAFTRTICFLLRPIHKRPWERERRREGEGEKKLLLKPPSFR